MQTSVKVDITKAIKKLNDLQQKQIPFALSLAINRAASKLKSELEEGLPSVFDSPTPYTQGSLYMKASTKRNLSATVGYKKRASNYLRPNIMGGERIIKASESALRSSGVMGNNQYLTPGSGARLDRYGNISRGQIMQVIAYFRANPFSRGNVTMKSLSRRKKQGQPLRFFAITHNYGHLPPGIYQAIGNGRNIKQIFQFVRKPAYKKRYPFYKTSENSINKNFPILFDEALRQALESAR